MNSTSIISASALESNELLDADYETINWDNLDLQPAGYDILIAADDDDNPDRGDTEAAAVFNEHCELAERHGIPPTYNGHSVIIAVLVGSLAADLSASPEYETQIRECLSLRVSACATATTSEACPLNPAVEDGCCCISEGSCEFAEDAKILAEKYLDAGLSIIPVTEGKKPSIASWKKYQSAAATLSEVSNWLINPRTLGFGIVGGKVSGNLEIIDIDDAEAKQDYLELLEKTDPALLARLVIVESPKGGLHLYYRCEQTEGNQKLATAMEEGQVRVLIETRGEGGYVVAPGSDARVHPLKKPYRIQQGDLAAIPVLTQAERNTLLELARALNRQVKESRIDQQLNKGSKTQSDQLRPGDDFNACATWDEVLIPYGWQIDHVAKDETYWIRPGKTAGISATTNYAGSDKLVVFSTSTLFETDTSYSKFAAYAVLKHGGDFSKAAADLAEQGYGDSGAGAATKKHASMLVALTDDAELFNFNDEGYATVQVDQHEETYRLDSKGFRTWLSRQFYLAHKTTTSANTMEEALQALTGKALFEGSTLPVNVRVAGDHERIYLDLADEDWRVVEVDKNGWRILNRSPVKFIRPHGMKPLPAPTPSGSLQDLRSLVNVQSDQDWLLLLSWLEYCLTPSRGYPILAISGEQGSAKSTTSRMLRRLVDNNKSLLRSLPKNGQDLAVTAGNSWLLAFDNLSGIKADMSDLLCSVSTGGGFATRKLYENDEEVQFEYCRPILLNGISDVLARPDILDRTISINLPAIDESHRRCEDEIWADFDAKAGGILGALLDVIAQGISRRGQVQLLKKPRMADFAVFATACEKANGFKDGEFLSAYSGNRSEAQDALVEGDILASTLLGWTGSPYFKNNWKGTYEGLLQQLVDRAADKSRDPFFPKTARALSNAVRRLAPILRGRGVEITSLPRSHGGVRMIQVTVRKPTGDGSGDGGDGAGSTVTSTVTTENSENRPENAAW